MCLKFSNHLLEVFSVQKMTFESSCLDLFDLFWTLSCLNHKVTVATHGGVLFAFSESWKRLVAPTSILRKAKAFCSLHCAALNCLATGNRKTVPLPLFIPRKSKNRVKRPQLVSKQVSVVTRCARIWLVTRQVTMASQRCLVTKLWRHYSACLGRCYQWTLCIVVVCQWIAL